MAMGYTGYNDNDMRNREMDKPETDQQASGGVINGEHCKTAGGQLVWE